MYEILEATYQDGHLILNKKLNSNLEGKTLSIIVLDTEEVEKRKERFLKFIAKQGFALPKDYTFNREALYER